MEENIIQSILKKIGLDNLEIACYLALLKRSPMRASEISKKLDVPKATVLVALYRLSDQLGIIKRAKNKNSFLFLVEDANDLLNHLKRKEDEISRNRKEIENLLPELRSMQNYDAKKPRIYYYEGKGGMRQAFEQVLSEADEIIGYGSNEDDYKYLKELFPDYYERRVYRKISVKAIIPATKFNIEETLKNEIRHLRKTNLIPAEFNYPIQVNIYKNTSVFYSFEESFALMIKSQPIADCLKKIFEFAFNKAGEYDREIRKQN